MLKLTIMTIGDPCLIYRNILSKANASFCTCLTFKTSVLQPRHKWQSSQALEAMMGCCQKRQDLSSKVNMAQWITAPMAKIWVVDFHHWLLDCKWVLPCSQEIFQSTLTVIMSVRLIVGKHLSGWYNGMIKTHCPIWYGGREGVCSFGCHFFWLFKCRENTCFGV